MSEQQEWDRVDDYLSDMLVQSDPALDLALRSSAEAGLPAINVSPNQGKLLHLLARMSGARHILEVGTLGGYSTIWLARALAPGGRLVSLEKIHHHAQIARNNIHSAELDDMVDIVVDDALASLDRLIADGVEPFDFIFLDADKENNAAYLERALRLSRPGTVIVGDNVVRKGRITHEGNTDPDVLGVRKFLTLMADSPELDSTAVQTVGSKGWDGFSLSIVSDRT
ncbi:O-methyltransferase [Allopusillimonas soli]|uniref:O-methyltransferase n=1 Tax=Allopusillimonas soli TaxID=659016 RepID=A0A853F7Z5_9BURK|nr:O-methyltransferase [Allopusillimonas soli]NYT36725.1 O-methyltransferase [Allopusillimonas soli]TEA75201.1 O-methyltransferase [Allopusillimonas soli]